MTEQRRPRCFLSGPISNGDSLDQKQSAVWVETAMKIAYSLWKIGVAPFVPHLSWHFPWRDKMTHDDWMDFDNPWLESSDCVYRMAGASVGADVEVSRAVKLGIPVFHNLENLAEWLREWKSSTATRSQSAPAENELRRSFRLTDQQRAAVKEEIRAGYLEAREKCEKLSGRAEKERQEDIAKLAASGLKPGEPCKPDNLHRFESGAVRSTDADTCRFDLISPIALRRLAETYAEGAAKYPPNPVTHQCNYKKGIPASNLMNHLLRHIFLWLAGDKSEPHLEHAAWGLFTIMHFEETRPDLIDVYERMPK